MCSFLMPKPDSLDLVSMLFKCSSFQRAPMHPSPLWLTKENPRHSMGELVMCASAVVDKLPQDPWKKWGTF